LVSKTISLSPLSVQLFLPGDFQSRHYTAAYRNRRKPQQRSYIKDDVMYNLLLFAFVQLCYALYNYTRFYIAQLAFYVYLIIINSSPGSADWEIKEREN
jgi:hypothetical protein